MQFKIVAMEEKSTILDEPIPIRLRSYNGKNIADEVSLSMLVDDKWITLIYINGDHRDIKIFDLSDVEARKLEGVGMKIDWDNKQKPHIKIRRER